MTTFLTIMVTGLGLRAAWLILGIRTLAQRLRANRG